MCTSSPKASSLARLLIAVALLTAGALVVPSERASAEDASYETEHFSITFSRDANDPDAPEQTDADLDGVPDSVERLGAALERGRALIVGELGYKPPPNEGLYPVYIARAFGQGFVRVAPGDSRSRSSYMVIPPERLASTAPDVAIAALAVHEYFHAVQYGYDYRADYWFTEASSAWIEERLDDAANTPLFTLNDFVPHPEQGFTSLPGVGEYGAFLFLEFLSERYDAGRPDVVRALWEQMAAGWASGTGSEVSSMAAVESWLQGRGFTLSESWNEFMLWRLRLGHFSEGDAYRAAVTEPWPAYPTDTKVSRQTCRLVAGGGNLTPFGSAYARLKPTRRGPHEATLTATGPAGATGFVSVKPRGEPERITPLVFGSDGVAQADVAFSRRTVPRLIVALGNTSLSEPATIAYSLMRSHAWNADVTSSVPSSVEFGTSIRVQGTASCAGRPAPFARVELAETLTDGSTTTHSLVTDDEGRWSISLSPEESASYVAKLVDPLLPAATTASRFNAVKPLVAIDVAEQVALGDDIEVTGTVTPVHAGAPIVLEYRRPARSEWLLGAEVTLEPDGTYGGSFTLPERGFWEVRARMTSTLDEDHRPGTSGTKTVEVSD
ncbi:MAG: hypothetical protein ACR2KQ_06685 [Actinomycetota bacterium]